MTILQFHELLLNGGDKNGDVVVPAWDRNELFNDIKELLMALETLQSQREGTSND